MPTLRTITGPVPDAIAAQVTALADSAARHDGTAPLGEQTLLDLRDQGTASVHHLATDDGGRIIGYAWLAAGATPSAEVVVAPHARRRGVGTALLARVGDTARGSGRAAPRFWAHGNLPAARALAARAGLAEQRRLWQMHRDLVGGLPAAPLPEGVVVRTYVPDADDAAWLATNAAAFAAHPEQGRMTRADLLARRHEPWFRAEDLLLAERAGRLDAYVWLKVPPGEDTGEVYVLGVHPRARGTGLGRALTAVGLRHLAARGLGAAILFVEEDNAAAVRLYSWAGFSRSRVDVQYG